MSPLIETVPLRQPSSAAEVIPIAPRGVRVALSSGDVFYVDTELLGEVEAALSTQRRGMVRIGDRSVNPQQVAMLTLEPIPSIESPERLS